MTAMAWTAQTATPAPVTTIPAPVPDALQTAGAIVAIVLALIAGVLGYRILRGGRGL